MQNIRHHLLIILLLVISIRAVAQFDGIYSQYMHLQHYYNPASIGNQDYMKILVGQKLQWIGINGAPKTTLFTVNTPFAIKKTHHAAGIQFVSDVLGIYANQQINLQYAYKFKFEYGVLSVGANLGVINIICYGDSIKINESHTKAEQDPALPNGTQSGVGFDMGVGVHFQNNNWYAGISLLHVPGANITLRGRYIRGRYNFRVGQLLTAVGGYNFRVRQSNYYLKPSVLLYSDFSSWQLYMSLLLDYKHKYWGGIQYSYQNAVSLLFGAEIINGLEIGYCYDLPASQMIHATHGSHELYLSYDFNLFKQKTNHKHKSIRLL